MQVYLFNQKMLSVINRKEEITDETCLITEQEYEKIIETLENDGYFWRIDKYTVGCSGKAPSEDYKWNEETHEWEVCQDKVQKRIERERDLMWERIKERRELAGKNGVAVEISEGVIKHFHTTETARTEYNGIGILLSLDTYVPRNWKVMENEFVKMTKEVYKKLAIALAMKTETDYANGERLKALVYASDTPLEIDIETGWSEGF